MQVFVMYRFSEHTDEWEVIGVFSSMQLVKEATARLGELEIEITVCAMNLDSFQSIEALEEYQQELQEYDEKYHEEYQGGADEEWLYKS